MEVLISLLGTILTEANVRYGLLALGWVLSMLLGLKLMSVLRNESESTKELYDTIAELQEKRVRDVVKDRDSYTLLLNKLISVLEKLQPGSNKQFQKKKERPASTTEADTTEQVEGEDK